MAWWDSKWGKTNICSITQTRLRPGKNKEGFSYVIELNCKHRFYRSALIEWVKNQIKDCKSPTCPLCRNEILLLDLLSK